MPSSPMGTRLVRFPDDTQVGEGDAGTSAHWTDGFAHRTELGLSPAPRPFQLLPSSSGLKRVAAIRYQAVAPTCRYG